MERFLYDNIVKIAIVLTLPLWTAFALAEDVEEVVVIAQEVKQTETDALTDTKLISAIMPAVTWIAGGYGGNMMYRERGTQSVHSTVYRNGIPQNTPGSGWYDFGHDIVSGETVKVISGANSVMYGSGSIGGTVLIQDTITRGITGRLGNQDHRYISVAPTTWMQVTDFSVKQQARNDNEEYDKYENTSAKIIADAGDFKLYVTATDYAYDYDNCYTAEFSQSNDCLQDGERFTVSIRNEFITIGRTEDKVEYFTEGVSTYENESSRDFFRIGDTVDLSNLLQVTYGADGSRDQYGVHEKDDYGVFLSVNAEFALEYNFGLRAGNNDQNAMRLGIAKDQFFINFGTSYRRPNLYEVHGDAFVDGNEDLLPEEGVGYEIGFGALSLFRYEFEESIEYASGYNTTNIITPEITTTDPDTGEVTVTPAVTEDVYTNAMYNNSGSYITQGIRFANTWGPITLMLKFNDTDQTRIPEYITVITWQQTFKDVDYKVQYAGQFDRKPGAYDFLPEGQEYLDDLKKLSLFITKSFTNGMNLNFAVENITDEEVEVLPYYDNQGRQINLTLQYKW
jgi:outer membrane cobalamin receptor